MSKKEKDSRRLLASFKLDERVVNNFLDKQDNITNAIRYLIMKEVKENGYRNLNNIIPAKLTEEYFNFDFSALEDTVEISKDKDHETAKENEIINNELSISNDDNTEHPEIITNNNTVITNTPFNDTKDIAACYLDPED